jgi:hypothetical protein
MNYVNTYINKHLGMIIAIPAIALSLLLAGSVHAQTSTTTTGDTIGTTTTPGTPNTGAGGYAAVNELVLAGAAIAAGAGLVYLYRSNNPEQERV